MHHKVTRARVGVEKRPHSLGRTVNGTAQEGHMVSIVADLRGTPTYIVVAIVSLLVPDPARSAAAANRNGYAVNAGRPSSMHATRVSTESPFCA